MLYKLLLVLSIITVPAAAWSSTLQDNMDGTVSDKATGLTWQQQDDATRRNWKSARDYCKALSLGEHSDWRLPDPSELSSLVVYKESNPTIDENAFPATQSSGYWSGSSMDGNSWRAWYVDFHFGPVDFSRKTQSHYVRCVR